MPEPCTVVIFGATGNLTRTKLLPALYHLEAAGRLGRHTRILGFGRREWSDQDWRDRVLKDLKPRARGVLDTDMAESSARA